jgi:hypothetical protein
MHAQDRFPAVRFRAALTRACAHGDPAETHAQSLCAHGSVRPNQPRRNLAKRTFIPPPLNSGQRDSAGSRLTKILWCSKTRSATTTIPALATATTRWAKRSSLCRCRRTKWLPGFSVWRRFGDWPTHLERLNRHLMNFIVGAPRLRARYARLWRFWATCRHSRAGPWRRS